MLYNRTRKNEEYKRYEQKEQEVWTKSIKQMNIKTKQNEQKFQTGSSEKLIMYK